MKNTNRFIKDVESAHILVVDDDRINTAILRNALSDFHHVTEVHSGSSAVEHCRKYTPDLIILDVMMPGVNGITTCKIIRSMSQFKHIPIIFSTSATDIEEELECWEAGGCDFVPKPVAPRTLVQRVAVHLRKSNTLEQHRKLALYDSVTGIKNRYFYEEYLEIQKARAHREDAELSMLAFDIDFFKNYNDAYGHLAGDECLKKVANILVRECKRPSDLVARYGGEEFVAVLPDTSLFEARKLGTRIVEAVANAEIPNVGSPLEIVTISCGASSLLNITPEKSLFESADEKLYLAKEDGRNLCA